MAGHHTGAMLLEDTLPKKLLLGLKMWSGCLPSSQERPAPLCLHLRRSGWGLQGPSCQQIPLGTSCTGGLQQWRVLEGRVAAQGVSCYGWPSGACSMAMLSVPLHPTGQAADAVPAGDVPGVMPDPSFPPLSSPKMDVSSISTSSPPYARETSPCTGIFPSPAWL